MILLKKSEGRWIFQQLSEHGAPAGLQNVLFALRLLQPLSLQAAFVFINRLGWLEAIKNQTQGEKYKVQVGMWRKTEVKCWHADVLADNT